MYRPIRGILRNFLPHPFLEILARPLKSACFFIVHWQGVIELKEGGIMQSSISENLETLTSLSCSLAGLCRVCLYSLTFICAIGLVHCDNSSDNSGDNSGDNDPGPPPGPPVSIHVWLTSCEVGSNMEGCGNTMSEASGADNICQMRYAVDGGESAPGGTHKAIIATSTSLPQNFSIPNKESRAVQRPDGTPIANNWTDFFTASEPISVPIADGPQRTFWTGLDADFGSDLNCSDWTATTAQGAVGRSSKVDEKRLGGDLYFCRGGGTPGTYVLCVSY